ncbi:hypothetical protein SDC9_112762 [bioreactor metagenome]|uniref:Uncharacterized protein n=1 Tax=bioreactor metagenome TaxID=1076179 RepID=A0A645BL73_9ZZZZ
MKDHFPIAADCEMAGMSRLQTEAATITPEAKPVRARWTGSLMPFFMKNTQAAPAAVPKKGMRSPKNTSEFMRLASFYGRLQGARGGFSVLPTDGLKALVA